MKATDFNLKKFYLKEDLKEGWSKLPNIDREKYQPRDGLEGPIMTRSGKVVYYDNVEGKYYDPDTDMYLTYDQWKAFDPELPIKESEQSDVKVILDKHNITSVDDIEYGSKAYEELFSYYMDSGEMPYGTMKARDGDPDQWIADRVSDLGLIREDAGDDGYSWNCKKCGTANEFRMTPQEQQEYIDDWEKDNQDLVADGETGESALDWVLTTIGQESEMHIGSKCKKCGTVAVDTVVGEKADNSTDLMKQYKDNEHNNYHSENNLLLAKAFGTPKEVKMVELVLAKNKKQGYTDTMDSEWMYHNIHKKYYPELVKGKLKEVYGSIGEEASDQGFSGKEKNFIHDLCMMHDGVKRDPAGLKYLGTSETWNEGNVLSDKGKLTTLMLWVKKNKDAVEKRFSRKFGNYSNRDENGKVTASDGNQMLNDIINKIGSIGEQTVKGPRGHLSSIVADDLNEIDCWDGYRKDGTKPGTGKNKGKRVNNCVKEAGGYYTQPVYDMIKQHGYPKVMHKLLTSLHADVIQDFLNRVDLDEANLNESGSDESVKNIDEILVKMGAEAPSDIIADIMHWIDAHPGENLEDLIRQANGYYNDELEEGKYVSDAQRKAVHASKAEKK